MTADIPDTVVIEALEMVLKPLGTSMRHYSLHSARQGAVDAMRGVMVAERERCAAIADERAAICADACELIKRGELYPSSPSAFATENCARLEAKHISRLIRGEYPQVGNA